MGGTDSCTKETVINMAKIFRTLSNGLTESKSLSPEKIVAFNEHMQKVARDARINQARAVRSAKEVMLTR